MLAGIKAPPSRWTLRGHKVQGKTRTEGGPRGEREGGKKPAGNGDAAGAARGSSTSSTHGKPRARQACAQRLTARAGAERSSGRVSPQKGRGTGGRKGNEEEGREDTDPRCKRWDCILRSGGWLPAVQFADLWSPLRGRLRSPFSWNPARAAQTGMRSQAPKWGPGMRAAHKSPQRIPAPHRRAGKGPV